MSFERLKRSVVKSLAALLLVSSITNTALPGEQFTAPLPRPKPSIPTNGAPETASPPPAQTVSPGAAENCLVALTSLGVEYERVVSGETVPECAVANAVQLSAISTRNGGIDLPARPILNCDFARRFAAWVAMIAAPAVKAETGLELTGLQTGPGHVCRQRVGGAKISEHATGNAIDVTTLVLADDRQIAVASVGDVNSADYPLLTALKMSACGYFTTVLGPGAAETHEEHYHFDLGLHGKSENYRICE